nr:hypothetical protein [Tanacetum cinerariifolium]
MSNYVASDDLRDALSVLYLISAHLRGSVIARYKGYIGGYVLGIHVKDMVGLCFRELHVFEPEPIEDQPLPADTSPIPLSPGYVVDSDPEKDEKDSKEDPADYPADRGNNDDDESCNDDDDDDDVKKDEEEKEEEENLALADPFDVSTDDLVPSS